MNEQAPRAVRISLYRRDQRCEDDGISTVLHQRSVAGGEHRLARPRRAGAARSPSDLSSRWAEALLLQRTAGNAAVAGALRRTGTSLVLLQRQPKQPPGKKPPAKKRPKWVVDAQKELGAMFGKDPLVGKVVIKDYADLNATLQSATMFGAWTQSVTEIYIKDLSGQADPNDPRTAKWPLYTLRYVLRHEVEHVRQFAAQGGPSTWLHMLTFEQQAYGGDLVWLAGSEAERLIPDGRLRAQLATGALQTLTAITTLISSTANLTGPAREKALHQGMIAATLIPASAAADPKLLYKQP